MAYVYKNFVIYIFNISFFFSDSSLWSLNITYFVRLYNMSIHDFLFLLITLITFFHIVKELNYIFILVSLLWQNKCCLQLKCIWRLKDWLYVRQINKHNLITIHCKIYLNVYPVNFASAENQFLPYKVNLGFFPYQSFMLAVGSMFSIINPNILNIFGYITKFNCLEIILEVSLVTNPDQHKELKKVFIMLNLGYVRVMYRLEEPSRDSTP